MEAKENNKKLLIVVGVLLLFGGLSLAYFVTKILTSGNGGSTSATTAVINGATLKIEGILEFEDLDILPGHKTASGIKITATGNNELIPYNLIWKGTNTLTTPLNFTIYKTSEEVNVTSNCQRRSKAVGATTQLSEECTISNLDRLGSEVATGRINKNDSKVTLASDEFITATSTGDVKYYYIILEYPNLDEPQNEDLSGEFDGEVTVEESSITPDINILAAYVVQDDGSYKEVDDIPQEGYTINTEKSTCSNGAKVRWDYVHGGLLTLNLTRNGTSCYLYFDKSFAKDTILARVGDNLNEDVFPVFSTIATTDEGVYKIEDGMYGGTSYYWRGASTSNYVKFANYCWRIIRINGDGSIRLIYDGTTCHANGVSTTENLAVLNVPYNTNNNQSEYVGYTYTLGLQRPLVNTSANSSNLKIQTEEWYNDNLLDYDKFIAEGKYCNDREMAANNTWGSTNSHYYLGYSRLRNKHQPFLSCNENDTYLLKIGSIMGDEVELAGGIYEDNKSYYLYNGNYYWSMTPANFSGKGYMLVVSSYGRLGSGNGVNDNAIGIRPVINLKSNTIFQVDGNGTLDNPYVVAINN